MSLVAIIARVLASLAFFYAILCMIRIILSWLPSGQFGRSREIIRVVTQPFFKIFNNWRHLQLGNFDLTPLVGLAVLACLEKIFRDLAENGIISFHGILASLLLALGSLISSVFLFFALLILIRIIGFLTRQNSTSTFWMYLDHFINPLIYILCKPLYRKRVVSYIQGLATALAICIIVTVLAWFVINNLSYLINLISF